jgi:hypothetical protein
MLVEHYRMGNRTAHAGKSFIAAVANLQPETVLLELGGTWRAARIIDAYELSTRHSWRQYASRRVYINL